jgi:nucleotide-binding universal stress UspA family protein
MIEIKRILCPVDFSDFSRHALEHAVVLARWYGSTISVFHAYHLPRPPVMFGGFPVPVMSEPALPDVQEQVSGALAHFIKPFATSGTPFCLDVQVCEPVAGILAAAKSLPADLIVMGTHGHSGLDRLVLGSVTEKVLRKARSPVLTIPPPASHAPGDIRIRFDRILCPMDFSEPSMKALTYALALAQEADAALLLMNVLEGLSAEDRGVYAHVDPPGYEEALRETAYQRLRQVIPEDASTWCRPEELVVTGKAYREILRVARERDVRLIVMGVHGRNPIDLMLFGSTTHHVIRSATCPVLTLCG